MKFLNKKTVLFSVLAVMLTLVFIPVEMLAQSSGNEDVKGFFTGIFFKYFATTASFSAFVLIVAGFVLRMFEDAKNSVKQLITFLISVLLAIMGNWLQIGIFEGLPIVPSLLIAAQISFTSNGLFDLIKNLSKGK